MNEIDDEKSYGSFDIEENLKILNNLIKLNIIIFL